MALKLVAFLIVSACVVMVAQADQATYYTPPYVPSSCYGYQNQGNMIAAASLDQNGNNQLCGAMFRITCLGGTNGQACKNGRNGASVTVKVVDKCPGCNAKSFDLSQEAFSQIADTAVGRINIKAERV